LEFTGRSGRSKGILVGSQEDQEDQKEFWLAHRKFRKIKRNSGWFTGRSGRSKGILVGSQEVQEDQKEFWLAHRKFRKIKRKARMGGFPIPLERN
jgi:hypothetical protein